LAKKRKVYKGRAPALDATPAAELRRLTSKGVPKAALARQFGISRETVYAYLRNEGAGKASPGDRSDRPLPPVTAIS
jgi:DNA invertase Pin-like site-specific DNA recombinase